VFLSLRATFFWTMNCAGGYAVGERWLISVDHWFMVVVSVRAVPNGRIFGVGKWRGGYGEIFAFLGGLHGGFGKPSKVDHIVCLAEREHALFECCTED
jgi:hypothetical protein